MEAWGFSPSKRRSSYVGFSRGLCFVVRAFVAPVYPEQGRRASPPALRCCRRSGSVGRPSALPASRQGGEEHVTRQLFESLVPRGKMGRPEEIATVALFLASDDSNFVNGVELSVDGGMSAI